MDSVKAIQLHMQLITQLLYVVGIFIDLSKAFDTISHDKLLHKLNNHGIRGNALQLIKSYLYNRSQYVLALGENADKLPVKFRVPQGSVLGALLFIISINYIHRSSYLGKYILFADDTNIFVADKCKNTVCIQDTLSSRARLA